MLKVFDFLFGTLAGKLASGAVVLLGAFVWFKADQAMQRRVGRQAAINEIRGNNHAVRGLAENAGGKSLSSGSGGVLNPYYRN